VGPNQSVYRVPDTISDKAVSAANCAISQAYSGCEVGGVRLGQRVVVLGAGGLGLAAAAVANAMGAEVFVAEMDESRLEKATSFGAHHVIALDSSGSSDRIDQIRTATEDAADVVIDMTGVPSAFTEGLASTRVGGVLVSIGNIAPGRTVELDPGAFTRSGVHIRGCIRYPGTVLGSAIRLINSTPQFPWEALVDADYDFDDIPSALAAAEARTVTRAGIVMNHTHS
jgi:threonine dehydrogenase-like Zn-dependent dehydrogenase